jgi:hypothetical protein
LADRKTSPFASISFFRFCPFVTKLFFLLLVTLSFFFEETNELFSVFFLLVPDVEGAFFFDEISEGSKVLNGLDKGGTPGARIQLLGGL